MKYKIEEIRIKNFRSIFDLKLKISPSCNLVTVCGANNVGKTNFLRALDLFFSLDEWKFNPEIDIPYHIVKGSRGAGYRTKIKIKFFDLNSGDKVEIERIYTQKKGEGKVFEFKGKMGNKSLNEKEIKDFLKGFKFLFIESSNVNIPNLLSEIVKDEVLSLGLAKRNKSQKEALEKLQEFIESSKRTVSRIETDITRNFENMISDIEELKKFNWKFKILFPEFEYLKEAISSMISFTLYDANDTPVDTKGSGIQKLILLSVIDYIANKMKNYDIIWALDEPEAFLQPKLQKKLFNELKKLANNQHVFITTHSQFFIDLDNLSNIFLFQSDIEEKNYVRRPKEKFLMVKTYVYDDTGYKKLSKIKTQLGIESIDSWLVFNDNIIVEGNTDKKYLLALSEVLNEDLPNILVADGAQNMPNLLRFISEFLLDKGYSAKFLCLLDYDKEGKDVYNKIKIKKKNIIIYKEYIIRCDGLKSSDSSDAVILIEDFFYPEIIIEAVNSFLKEKEKKYPLLNVNELLEKRFNEAFRGKNILEFLMDELRQLDYNKPPPPLTDINVKKFICERSIEILRNSSLDKIKELDKKYPNVRKFIGSINSLFQT